VSRRRLHSRATGDGAWPVECDTGKAGASSRRGWSASAPTGLGLCATPLPRRSDPKITRSLAAAAEHAKNAKNAKQYDEDRLRNLGRTDRRVPVSTSAAWGWGLASRLQTA
jgi:hypothetical protein